MARKAPEPIDPMRRLAYVNPENGATGVSHDGIIYYRGMEKQLPPDFPADGPWWEDWTPDEVYDPRADLPAPEFSREELELIDADRVRSAERQRLARAGTANPHDGSFDDVTADGALDTGPPVVHNRARGKQKR